MLAEAKKQRSRLSAWLAAGMMLLVLLATAGSAVVLWEAWHAGLHRAQVQAANTAILIDHDIAATLDKVGVALGSVTAELERELPSANMHNHTLWALFDDTTALVPEIASIAVFDASGHQVCEPPTVRCRRLDASRSEYFQTLRRAPPGERALFGPLRSAVDAQWSFVVAQGMRAAGGGFDGVTVAWVPVDILRTRIASLDLGTSGVVSLRRDDLSLAVRHPGTPRDDDEALNRKVSGDLAAALKNDPDKGSYRGDNSFDDIQRQYAYRRLERYPLIVIVGLGVDEALAEWRAQAWWTASFLVLFIATSAAVVALLWRDMLSREHHQVELEDRVHQRTQQVRRLAGELEIAENRERQQIARDLHDDLGQTLAAARIRLDELCHSPQDDVRETAQRVAELVEQADRSTRSLATQLAPAVLYELGLGPALERLGEEVLRNFGVHVSVTDDGQPKPLSAEAKSILYRCARELLVNSAKHAGARQADVEVEADAGRVIVRISDAGVGFDVSAPRPGNGLRNVRERLGYIGGTFEVRSIPGDGTEAILSAPLAAAPPPHFPQRSTMPSRTA